MSRKQLPFFLLLLSCCALFSSIRANAQTWVPLNGPVGEEIQSIAIDSRNEVFVLSEFLFRSADRGKSWQVLMHALPTTHGGMLYAYDKVVFLADSNGQLWRSTDRGDSWLASIAFPNRIQQFCHFQDTVYVITSSGKTLYVSTNQGETWDQQALPVSGDIQVIVATTTGNLLIGTSSFLYRRAGDVWQRMSDGLPGETQNVRGLAVNPLTGSVYASIGQQGIFQSKNGGFIWTAFSASLNRPAKLYSDSTGSLLAVPTEGSIEIFLNDQPAPTSAYTPLLAEDLSSSLRPVAVEPNGSFWLGLNGNLYVQDRTEKRETISAPLGSVRAIAAHNASDVIIASTSSEFPEQKTYRSTDKGMSWVQQHVNSNDETSPYFSSFRTVAVDSSFNFIGALASVLYRSTDAGVTWERAMMDSLSGYVSNIAIGSKNEIFVSSTEHGILRSLDNGVSFQAFNDGLDQLTMYSVAVSPAGVMYAGGRNALYRYNGGNWQKLPLSSGSDTSRVNAITVARNGKVYAALQGSGIFVSSDFGDTWATASHPLLTINAMIATSGGQVIVGSPDGISRLEEGASSWNPFLNDGMNTFHVLSLSVDRLGYVYAGMRSNGIYRSNEPFTSPRSDVNTTEQTIDVQCFPNPVRDLFRVQTTYPDACIERLRMSDVHGKSVLELTNSGQVQNVEVDVRAIPAGLYFLEVSHTRGVGRQKVLVGEN